MFWLSYIFVWSLNLPYLSVFAKQTRPTILVTRRVSHFELDFLASSFPSSNPLFFCHSFPVIINSLHYLQQGFLSFERLTMCPIQVSLIDPELLSPAEKTWINEYHDEVLQKVSPILKKSGDERALKWLEKECKARIWRWWTSLRRRGWDVCFESLESPLSLPIFRSVYSYPIFDLTLSAFHKSKDV